MGKVRWYARVAVYLLVTVALSSGIVAVPSNILADGEVTFFSENFEGGLPGDWTVLDNGCDCWSNCCRNWTDSNPCNRTAQGGCSGIFMIADSKCCNPEPVMDTQLWTPSIDCSGYSTVRLEFDHYFRYVHLEKGDVDISSDGGANWTNILAYRDTALGHVSIDMSAQAAGESDLIIRWHYYDAWWCEYWEVDNVKVSGTRVLVGAEAYPIDKTGILALWIGLAALLVSGISWYALGRRRAHS
jgi:hypothetical protein